MTLSASSPFFQYFGINDPEMSQIAMPADAYLIFVLSGSYLTKSKRGLKVSNPCSNMEDYKEAAAYG
jgi:hypothetical protein